MVNSSLVVYPEEVFIISVDLKQIIGYFSTSKKSLVLITKYFMSYSEQFTFGKQPLVPCVPIQY